jgi:hypothetical protein
MKRHLFYVKLLVHCPQETTKEVVCARVATHLREALPTHTVKVITAKPVAKAYQTELPL